MIILLLMTEDVADFTARDAAVSIATFPAAQYGVVRFWSERTATFTRTPLRWTFTGLYIYNIYTN